MFKTTKGATRTIAVAVACLAGAFAASSPAASYPSPPPSFGHFEDPHSRLFSYVGGNRDRPMLVIYAQFSDVRFPEAIDATAMERRFFGPFPSVRGYYANDSGGRLLLSAAPESNSSLGGQADDGVVTVTIASTKQTFNGQSSGEQAKDILQAADRFVDFSAFDTDGDGRIKQEELVVHRVDADPDPVTAGCGASRTSLAVALDGVRLDGLKLAFGGTDTNLMTLIHETGHIAFEMPDTRFWDVAAFDTGGGTCQFSDATLFRSSAYLKLHLYWIIPTVVTRDGYYTVDRVTPSQRAFLLYDPDKGQDDYFLVENRARTSGTYDQGASDSGLVIWRIDDAAYTTDGNGQQGPSDNGYIDLTTPTTARGTRSAWDPSDPNTPQRAMSRMWRDGTASNVAVRAIGAAGASIKAYFDVRGPGILLDTYWLNADGDRPRLVPGQANPIEFTVRNTGESRDTFEFSAKKLPEGWTATTASRRLDPGAESTVTIEITPPSTKPQATYTQTVLLKGWSTTAPVSLTSSFVATVGPPLPSKGP